MKGVWEQERTILAVLVGSSVPDGGLGGAVKVGGAGTGRPHSPGERWPFLVYFKSENLGTWLMGQMDSMRGGEETGSAGGARAPGRGTLKRRALGGNIRVQFGCRPLSQWSPEPSAGRSRPEPRRKAGWRCHWVSLACNWHLESEEGWPGGRPEWAGRERLLALAGGVAGNLALSRCLWGRRGSNS